MISIPENCSNIKVDGTMWSLSDHNTWTSNQGELSSDDMVQHVIASASHTFYSPTGRELA